MKSTRLNPYLNFDGKCAEAMNFYQSILGGNLEMSTFGEPADSPTAGVESQRIMHAQLQNEGLLLMGSDVLPGHKQVLGDNVHLSLVGDNEAKLKAIFMGLAEEGGQISMPLKKQFWGDTFGMLTDRYGIHWMVNINATPTKKK